MAINIRSHQEIVDLIHRPEYPHGILTLNLERLGTLETAGMSYHALIQLIHPMTWACNKLYVLENYCAFLSDLDQIEVVLLPVIQIAPFLTIDCALALGAIKSKARAMKKAGKGYLKGIRIRSEMCARAVDFGDTVFGIVDDVLRGATPFNEFVQRIPNLIVRIQVLRNTEMRF